MKRNLIFIIILAAILMLAAGLWFLFVPPPPSSRPLSPVTIGTTPFEVSGLIFIAEDQRFFEENGILPTIRIYDAGINAVDALNAGDVDVATAADFVFSRQVLGRKPVQGIATIGKTEFHYIIARKDRGIGSVPDLKGKKIGVARGTSGDFFLGRFLELQGMSIRDVTLVDLPPAQVTDPLLNGTVDAVSTWDPYAYATEQRLGDNAQVWPDQKGRLMYWIAISREDYVTRNGTQVRNVLAALNQAEKFAVDHPGEAKAIIQKRLHTDDAYTGRVLPKTQLTLTLDQSLILAMEDEARWMIANNITNATTVPDFGEYIYPEGLDSVKPGSMNIIRSENTVNPGGYNVMP